MAVGTPSAYADDDDDGGIGVETDSDTSTGTDSDQDYGNPPILEPSTDLVPPQPYEGEPVDQDQPTSDGDDRNASVDGFDFDASAPDIMDNAGEDE